MVSIMTALLLAAYNVIQCARAGSSPKPHILHIIADDLGWADVGYHRAPDAKGDVMTPNIDNLAKVDGFELDRFYAHKICSPSRCAFQSGRAPAHVMQNVVPEVRNLKDNDMGFRDAS